MVDTKAIDDVALNKNSKKESLRKSRRLTKRDAQTDHKEVSLETPPEDGPKDASGHQDSPDASSSNNSVNGMALERASTEGSFSLQSKELGNDRITIKRSITEPSISIRIKRPKKQVKKVSIDEARTGSKENKLKSILKQETSEKAILESSTSSSSLHNPVLPLGDLPQEVHGQVDIHPSRDLPSTVPSAQEINTSSQSPFRFTTLPQPPLQVFPGIYDCVQCASSLSHTASDTPIEPNQPIILGLHAASEHLPSPFYPNTDTVRPQSGGNFQGEYREQSFGIPTERHQVHASDTLAPAYNPDTNHHPPYPYFEPWRTRETKAPQFNFPPLPIPYSEYCCIGREAMPPVLRSSSQRVGTGASRLNREDANATRGPDVDREDHAMNGIEQAALQRPVSSISRPLSRSATPGPLSPVSKRVKKVSPKKAIKDKLKPQRCAVACEECRDFKRKCSGTLPCKLCVKRDKPEKCRYQAGPAARARSIMKSSKEEEEDDDEETEVEDEESSPKVRIEKTQETEKTQAVKKTKKKKSKILTSPRFHGNRIPPTIQSDDKLERLPNQDQEDQDMGEVERDLLGNVEDIETSVDSDHLALEEDGDSFSPRSSHPAAFSTAAALSPTAQISSIPPLPPHLVRFHSSSLSLIRPPQFSKLDRVAPQVPVRRTSWDTSNGHHHGQLSPREVFHPLAYPPLPSRQMPNWQSPRSASALGSFPSSMQVRSSPPDTCFHNGAPTLSRFHSSPTSMEPYPSSSKTLPNRVPESDLEHDARVDGDAVEETTMESPIASASYHHSKSKSGLDSLVDAVDLKISKTD